ncbi:glycosyltransferase family 9 protein [Candidatus Pacearchaeota archaeon]|nr:glycosyltransferase family 9 protein [Candidatus Pacearchaeota archaeon]
MKTLIINIGPPGDVLRTTVLLSALDGEIDWLTSSKCKEVLLSKKIKTIYFIDSPPSIENLIKDKYDVVISLNEEEKAMKILPLIKHTKLIGVYPEKMKVFYTPESAPWFDMSLVSTFGKQKADELKMNNKKTLQEMLLTMVNKKWINQTYDLGIKPSKKLTGKVGMINVATGLWPNKNWAGYEQLAEQLKQEGIIVNFLGIKPTITEHIHDINQCDLIVCGDTLGLHIALALKKKVVVLFNCTSPYEIYDYGLAIKIISPKLKEYFYKKEYSLEATTAIDVATVYQAVKKQLKTLGKKNKND